MAIETSDKISTLFNSVSAISLAAITIAFSSEVIAATSAVPNKPLCF